MEGQSVSDVFISHVEEDEGIALAIAQGLQQAGYTTWRYEENSQPRPGRPAGRPSPAIRLAPTPQLL